MMPVKRIALNEVFKMLFLMIILGIIPQVARAQIMFRSKVSGMWNSNTTWEQSSNAGVSWISATGTPTNVSGSITIQSGHNITLSSATLVDQLTINSGGVLTINSGIACTINDGSDVNDLVNNGQIVNYGSLTLQVATAKISMGSNSVYNHAINGGNIPTCTWLQGSECLITGFLSGTSVAGTGQNFHHFTWRCPLQSTSNNLSQNILIAGNLSVENTGSGSLIMSNGTVASNLNVSGNLIIGSSSGGAAILDICSGGNISVNTHLTLKGNLNVFSGRNY